MKTEQAMGERLRNEWPEALDFLAMLRATNKVNGTVTYLRLEIDGVPRLAVSYGISPELMETLRVLNTKEPVLQDKKNDFSINFLDIPGKMSFESGATATFDQIKQVLENAPQAIKIEPRIPGFPNGN